MRNRRPQPITDINIVPFLDVLLVLLVIFMITTPLFNQGVVDLPKVGEKALPQAKKSALEIVYEESAGNPYRLIDHRRNEESARLSEEQLMEELSAKSILYEETYIIISAEGALPYKDVIKLLGRLRDDGFDNVALSAQTDSK